MLTMCPEKSRFDSHASLRPEKDVCRNGRVPTHADVQPGPANRQMSLKQVKKVFNEAAINLLDWPRNSPDINPIRAFSQF